jgi:hypothetical protein
MSLYINPPSKVWHHDMQGSPGGRQICLSERDGVEDGSIDVVSCPKFLQWNFETFACAWN